jgi:hypothetical protein
MGVLADISSEGLAPGDVGTIVHVYREVEADQLRPVTARDMTHAREMQTA